jgi:hypothetical protein
MDMDARLWAEPVRVIPGIVEEVGVPEESPVPDDCAVITVKKGTETMQFCVPLRDDE